MAVTYLNKNHKAVYAGLSTDEKPIKVGNGALFYEMDTGNIYMFDKQNKVWCIQANDGGGAGGTSDHSKLSNRDKADQHPISAITGLQEALDKGGGISVKDAKVGQLIRAKAVDETGNITEYEPVPFMYEDVTLQNAYPETVINIQNGRGIIPQFSNPLYVEGTKAEIWINGIKYDTVIKKSPKMNILAMGNLAIGNPGNPDIFPDTGEPYLIEARTTGSTLGNYYSKPETSTPETNLKIDVLAASKVEIPIEYLSSKALIIKKEDVTSWTANDWNAMYTAFSEGRQCFIKDYYNKYSVIILAFYRSTDDSGQIIVHSDRDIVSYERSYGVTEYSELSVPSYGSEAQKKCYLHVSEYGALTWNNPALGPWEASSIILPSTTPDSTKKFKITVDDTGTIKATEVVEQV